MINFHKRNKHEHSTCGKVCEFRLTQNIPVLSPDNMVRVSTPHYSRLSKSRAEGRRSMIKDMECYSPIVPFATTSTNNIRKGMRISEIENIPRSKIKTVITELNYLLEQKGVLEGEIETSLQMLARKTAQQLNNLTQTQQKVESLTAQNKKLADTVKHLEEEVRRKKLRKPDVQVLSEIQTNRLLIQNNKLGIMNEELRKQIKILQQSHNVQKLTTQSENGDDMAEDRGEYVGSLKDRIKYLTLKLSSQKQNNLVCIKKLEENDAHIEELKKKIEAHQADMVKVKQQLFRWRERAIMQKQDTEAYSSRQQYLLYSIKKLTQINKKITNRLVKVNQNRKQLTVGERNPLFSYEVDFFKGIRSTYEDNRVAQYKYHMRGRNPELGLKFEYMDFEVEYAKATKDDDVYLPQLSFVKPSFYLFIQHMKDTQDSNEQQRNGEISRSFMQTLRCIINCKLNEFVMIEDVDAYTRFPEFVMAWFEKYFFDTDNCCIAPMKVKEEGAAKKFYKDLMNIRLDQSWEIITFRQFLLEELSLEQLYFYLQCQNMLFRKAGISKEFQYLGEFCIMVEYTAAKTTLEMVLSEFDSWNINFLMNKLAEKIVVKKNVEYIDSGFFLRCLLEYYKIERLNRFKLLKKMCQELCTQEGHSGSNSQKQPGEINITFIKFIKLFDRLVDLTLEVKLKLYRDCYSVARGKITADVIFTVCTENRIFLKFLRLKSFYRLPMQISRTVEPNKTVFCVQPTYPYLYKIFNSMRVFLDDSSTFSSETNNLGVESVCGKVEFFRNYFNRNKQMFDNSVLKGKHFIHFIGQLTHKIRQVSFNNLYEILEEADRKALRFTVDVDENQLGELYLADFDSAVRLYQESFELISWKKKVVQFRLNNAAKKIQRKVREKFIQPYLEMYNIMFQKAKKAKLMGGGNLRDRRR